MCTVTIIPHETGIRLACNRDESRLRPAALAPRIVTAGARRAVMPIDPASAGTWIAANDRGLVMTLLNLYPHPYAPGVPPPRRSRGTIIPWLMTTATLEEACTQAQALAVSEYSSFRLVIADHARCVDMLSNDGALICGPLLSLDRPILFTSSGLGDGRVEPPRRALFEDVFRTRGDWRAQQDAFHRHSWPDRREVSVCMSRPEACTVSFTSVVLNALVVQMAYYPKAPDEPTVPVEIVLFQGSA